jgi:hypothetical protein
MTEGLGHMYISVIHQPCLLTLSVEYTEQHGFRMLYWEATHMFGYDMHQPLSGICGTGLHFRNMKVITVQNYLSFSWRCKKATCSVAWVRERTIPTERPPLVGEVSANFLWIECHVVSVTDTYGHILGFLDRSRYFFFRSAPQLYSRGWVDPVPDLLLFRKSGSVGNRTRTSGSVARNSDH